MIIWWDDSGSGFDWSGGVGAAVPAAAGGDYFIRARRRLRR